MPGFARLVALEDIRSQQHKLSIPLYLRNETPADGVDDEADHWLEEVIESWQVSSRELSKPMSTLLATLAKTTTDKR